MYSTLRVRSAFLALSATLPLSGASAAMIAIPISPGAAEPGALVADLCPTFSWGAVTGAERYDLALFDARWGESTDYETQSLAGAPLYQIAIDAPALSWTPAGERCLEDGGRYLWFVRAHGLDGASPWSGGQPFEIDFQASALSELVRREVSAQLGEPQTWNALVQEALAGHRTLALNWPAAASGAAARHSDQSADEASALTTLAGSRDSHAQAASFNTTALRVSSANGVVFDDPSGGGVIPAEGSGKRFMWYPGKAALRAGYASVDQWDDAKIGQYSFATGFGTTASGTASTAMGLGASATADYAMAMGVNATASGERSTAIGDGVQASGRYSLAMGYQTAANDDASVAMGRGTVAGRASTAMGLGTTAVSQSTAMGVGSAAEGEFSTAMGYQTTASGSWSTAMGNATEASGWVSTAMGRGTHAESAYETVIGRFDSDYTPASTSSWNSSDRLFVIGNGSDWDARSDALLVHKNGNLTISGSAYKPGGGTWASTSDGRLKAVSGSYEPGLEAIRRLESVRFRYLPDNPRGHDPAPEYVGFVAQQVEAVLPEAVSEGADGYLDLDMHVIHVAMVNAIREQQDQITAQQGQISALRAELEALRRALASMRASQTP